MSVWRKYNRIKWFRLTLFALMVALISLIGIVTTLSAYVSKIEGDVSVGVVYFSTSGNYDDEEAHRVQTVFFDPNKSNGRLTYVVVGQNDGEKKVNVSVEIDTTGNLPLVFTVNDSTQALLTINTPDHRKYVADLGELSIGGRKKYTIKGAFDEAPSYEISRETDVVTVTFVCSQAVQ